MRATNHQTRLPVTGTDGVEELEALVDLAGRLIAHAPDAAVQLRTWHAGAALLLEQGEPGALAIEDLTIDLRQRWLKVAHDTAHSHFRSPLGEDDTCLPSGRAVDFGYERELDPSRLESRAARFIPKASGRDAHHLIFSSGQSALSAILMQAGAGAQGRALRVAHVGSYFETAELLCLMGADVWSGADAQHHLAEADLVIIEPVYLGERFHCVSIERLADELRVAVPPLVVVDATISHLTFPIARFAALLPQQTALIRISSLLKLDQAGLELANAGLMSIFDRDAGDLAEKLTRIRSTTGTGLAFADLCALDVPFVFDAAFATRYAASVFANNAELARTLRIGAASRRIAHPVLDCDSAPWSVAPYVAIRLEGNSPERYEALANRLSEGAARLALPLRRGGSFGFRTHRFDVVTPKDAAPFLRVAMGAARLGVSGTARLIATECDNWA